MIGVRRRRIGLLRRHGLPMRNLRKCRASSLVALPDEDLERTKVVQTRRRHRPRGSVCEWSVRVGGPGNEEMLRGQGRAPGKGTASVYDSESE